MPDKNVITEKALFINRVAAASADILYVLDIDTKIILYTNRKIGVELGYSDDELSNIDNHLFYFMHEDDKEAMVEHIENMRFAADDEVREIEYRMTHADASIHWYIDRNTVFKRGIDGLATEKLGISQDITEKKQIETKLKLANASILKQNKVLEQRNKELISLSQVASTDLREPLKKIYTAVEAIITADAKNLSNNGRAHLRRLQSAVQRMGLIADDLFSFTRLTGENISFSKADLNSVLIEAKKLLTKSIEQKNAEITSDELPVINGSYSFLVELFKNIIHNALKFQPEDRRPLIQITCAVFYDEGNMHCLRISFKDNGIGFKQENADDIFTLFTRLHGKEQYGGNGSGLAICKKIMEIHKGSIEAVSTPGKCTEIRCTFPL